MSCCGNKSDKDRIKELEAQVEKLRAKLYSGIEAKSYEDWQGKAHKTLVDYLETMAAAFCKYTDINPNECVLCSTVTDEGKQLVYWMERREGPYKDLSAVQEFKYIDG